MHIANYELAKAKILMSHHLLLEVIMAVRQTDHTYHTSVAASNIILEKKQRLDATRSPCRKYFTVPSIENSGVGKITTNGGPGQLTQ